jgi:hypothetical protein
VLIDGDMDTWSFGLNNDWEDAKNMEIWEDHMTMFMLEGINCQKSVLM